MYDVFSNISFKSFFYNNPINIYSLAAKIIMAVVFFIGLLVFKDYGVSWDEPTSQMNGIVSLNYIVEILSGSHSNHITKLHNYYDKDYPVFFELILIVFERLVYGSVADSRSVYLLRHLLTFCMWCVGGIAMYKLACLRFQEPSIRLFLLLFYFINPRFFAEGFYNDKDIVFMAFFTIAFLYNAKFILSPSYKTALFAAVTTALAIDVRIMAILLTVITPMIISVRLYKNTTIKNIFFLVIFYGTITISVMVMFWPFLWENPIKNFLFSFENAKKFRWRENVLFNGNIISAWSLPWHYLFVWIGITTPIYMVFLYLVGVIGVAKGVMTEIRFFVLSPNRLIDAFALIFLVVLFGNIILLKAVVYDGWRHIYFIFPLLLILAGNGLELCYQLLKNRVNKAINKQLFLAVIIIQMGYISIWMIQSHPLQNVYFNVLAGNDLINRWEKDYWGLSTRMGLEQILSIDKRSKITVSTASKWFPAKNGLLLIDKVERDRIKIVSNSERPPADYVITNYRGVRIPIDNQVDNYHLFWEKLVDNDIVIRVFRHTRLIDG